MFVHWKVNQMSRSSKEQSVSSETGNQQDGALVIGARCTADGCDWELGTDDPDHWDIVERLRLDHEEETGHTVTVETLRQRTIVAKKSDEWSLGEWTIDNVADDVIEWICPDCEKTSEELEATKRCPDCDEPFREVLP